MTGTRKLGATLLTAALTLSVWGCAGRAPRNPARERFSGNAPGGAPGGSATPGGSTGGITGANVTGLTPPPPASSQSGLELGQQISAYIAGPSGLGGTRMGFGARTGGAGSAPGDRVRGNVGVSTLVVANTAYVGIDMSTVGPAAAGTGVGPAVNPGGRAGDAAGGAGWSGGVSLEESARIHVKAAFPQLADVFVTSDPGLVHRLARIGADVQSGVSVAGRMHEIAAITRAMNGTAGAATGGTR